MLGVLFDYGNTLVTFERPDGALEAAYERIEQHLRLEGLTPPAATVLLKDVHDRVEDEFAVHQASGRLEEIDLVAAAGQAYADLGLPLDESTLDTVLRLEQQAWWQGVQLDAEAIPTIDTLRERGLRVGLCSNALYRIRSMHDQLAHLGVDRHLDSVTFSGAVGWRKPSARIFEAAAEALGVRISDAVMVGDSVRDDIAGAGGCGMRSILLRRSTSQLHTVDATVPVVDRVRDVTQVLFSTACI